MDHKIPPRGFAEFVTHPEIWIGVVSSIEEGSIINSAVEQEIRTRFDLARIESADIVMTGGGSGPNSRPFMFTLENVVRA